MSTDHLSCQLNKSTAKVPNDDHYREEVFLNAFISIAQKGIAEWEHLRKTKGKDG